MNGSPNRRNWRNLLIRRDIQLPLAFFNLVSIAVSLGLMTLAVLFPLFDAIDAADNVWAQNISAKLFVVVIDRFLLAAVAVVVLGSVYHLMITHRFCGPLVNFARTFERMARGDLTRKVHLRRQDFLKVEAAQVNAVIDAIAGRVDELKRRHLLLQHCMGEWIDPERRPHKPESRAGEILDHLQAVGRLLEQFQTTPAAPAKPGPSGDYPHRDPSAGGQDHGGRGRFHPHSY
jgi:hypothetical protein